jgi:hypothetical protein
MRARRALFTVAALWPGLAAAHSFGQPLTLPVPLWLYLYGSVAALVLSFVVLGWQGAGGAPPAEAEPGSRVPTAPGWLASASAALFLLALATAWFGTPNPYRNFSMTFFWIVFLLGGFYACALVGEAVQAINPWRTLLLGLEARRPRPAREAAGCWPALLLYFALIVLELFGPGTPRSLAIALLVYTAITFVGGWRCGGAAWLRRGELFHVLFGMASRLAPVGRGAGGRWHWRSPVARLATETASGGSALLFVLFMLSSTAFDGLKETVLWNGWYWERLAPALAPHFGNNLARAYPVLAQVQAGFNALVLLLSPFLYLAVCAMALLAMRALMPAALGRQWSLRALLLAFAPSLIPIAVAYNAAHYATLLLAQGSRLGGLLLDPFGWNTASSLARLLPPSALATWHAQVGIILLGHVLGMAVCHRRLWLPGATKSRNWAVQLPLLLLMTALTASGLWVMAQPVSPSRAM